MKKILLFCKGYCRWSWRSWCTGTNWTKSELFLGIEHVRILFLLSQVCLFSQGSPGARGKKGPSGATGVQGVTGDVGLPGPDGQPGKAVSITDRVFIII